MDHFCFQYITWNTNSIWNGSLHMLSWASIKYNVLKTFNGKLHSLYTKFQTIMMVEFKKITKLNIGSWTELNTLKYSIANTIRPSGNAKLTLQFIQATNQKQKKNQERPNLRKIRDLRPCVYKSQRCSHRSELEEDVPG